MRGNRSSEDQILGVLKETDNTSSKASEARSHETRQTYLQTNEVLIACTSVYHLFLNLKSPSHRTGFERTHRWNCLGAVSVARSHDQQGPFGKAEEGKVCCRGRSPSRRIWSGDGRSGTAVASLGPHSYECVHFGVPPIFEPKSPRLTERKLNSVEESKPPAEALDRRASRRKLGH